MGRTDVGGHRAEKAVADEKHQHGVAAAHFRLDDMPVAIDALEAVIAGAGLAAHRERQSLPIHKGVFQAPPGAFLHGVDEGRPQSCGHLGREQGLRCLGTAAQKDLIRCLSGKVQRANAHEGLVLAVVDDNAHQLRQGGGAIR